MLQHLEGADHRAELFSGLGVFQRRGVQFGHGADRFSTKRADDAVTTGLQRGHTFALTAEQLSPDVAQADLGGAAAIDGLEALQVEIGSTSIDHE